MKKLLFCLLMIGMLASCSTSKKLSSNDGEGSSYDKAVVITSKNETEGINAEYAWLKEHYPGYKTEMQSLNYQNKKPYDILNIITADGTKKSVYFDISGFFGKW